MDRRHLLAGLGALALPALAAKPDLRVGPNEKVRTLAEAARLAREGWLIEVAAGEYRSDVASWRRDGLRLRAVGGRVRLIAEGAQAEGKGLFVVNGRGVEIEGFDFSGATVSDRNGAGIRFESGTLTLRDCSFSDCEMGLITSNEGSARLIVEDCEFSRPRGAEGFTHLLYTGRIAHLEVRGCHFHDGAHGHLLKSRAALSRVEYNRFVSSRASYELEFPNGGRVRVIGNLIEQGRESENPLMLSYGTEGYGWPRNELDLAHNSWIDRLGGTPVRVAAGGQTQVRAYNNLLLGRRPWRDETDWQAAGNQQIPLEGPQTLLPPAPLPPELMPTHQVGDPRGLRRLAGPARRVGALQNP
ncbi:right-handed parallel beta-helix repeat-containing protein [Pelomonas sp. V22]|uniref:right-handed parallel beta-helix repeat-containing protein n=1 Tax=Pelomonas sp. V22 TaxID=2822139 RepID=UPI0024A888F5|nr:right-handed parallel beta-helix repeat-containing protein [Pelomonas sp. V22]MDI4635583.1 right-handed parallel beta-helix repeat-containing protein [Pelomonas sp. V22]